MLLTLNVVRCVWSRGVQAELCGESFVAQASDLGVHATWAPGEHDHVQVTLRDIAVHQVRKHTKPDMLVSTLHAEFHDKRGDASQRKLPPPIVGCVLHLVLSVLYST